MTALSALKFNLNSKFCVADAVHFIEILAVFYDHAFHLGPQQFCIHLNCLHLADLV